MAFTLPDLCDAHADAVRVMDPVFRDFGGRRAFHGRAVTVACFEDNSRIRDLVARPGLGRVLAVDGAGSLRRALLGDQLAQQALANGWSGLVIHGCVRDVEVLATLDLGVRALAAHPMKTEKKGLGEVDVPLAFAGVHIAPGEWIYADANGIAVAAAELA
ncbi:ribonuclease E activity regulator RraA [Coralloluteibacterium stylophorae]|uniref:4-hydroxy-4-methyl-2-oxoglutarate aldolase n=1 Tax=Coralloluteibacterium stylophorae TaxID=1776034 RepID=A0A8J7VYY1_9GAMM|nr:ribonuclease E activity regulator RraA [Coralloluteibacterium stylophorae]MBS7458412.1 ribonuclease E activity regulator RraA [Coralloluteibacterium stylophorae]